MKVAIITGSSQGIGKALALHMAEKGIQVVLNGRNTERLETAQQFFAEKNLETLAVQGDVSKYSDCEILLEKTLQKFGRVDILVNNAGLTMEGKVEDTHPEVFQKVMNVNYLGSVYPTKLALPHLRKTKGSVLFISSLAAIYGLPNFSVYSASKMTLKGLTEALRLELKGTDVHIGLAYVGFTQNDKQKKFYNAKGELEILPKRTNVKTEPVDQVAAKLMKMIERRTKRKIFSNLGKLLVTLYSISPSLVDEILAYKFKNRK